MKKHSFLLIASVFILTAFGCNSPQVLDDPLDVAQEVEIADKSPEDWLDLVATASEENDNIRDYLPTLTCLPVKSEACDSNQNCKDAEPSNFLFITSFETDNATTLSVTRNVYRCNETSGCGKKEYAYFYDKGEEVERLQFGDYEISIDAEKNYTDTSVVGVNTVSNSGVCYYRDELAIAEVKVESNNVYDSICTVDESHFGVDWVGINETFVLTAETELRASPIAMECNVLDYLSAGESITIQTETNGAFNGEDPFIWLEINYNGETGWIRGDFVDERFLQI